MEFFETWHLVGYIGLPVVLMVVAWRGTVYEDCAICELPLQRTLAWASSLVWFLIMMGTGWDYAFRWYQEKLQVFSGVLPAVVTIVVYGLGATLFAGLLWLALQVGVGAKIGRIKTQIEERRRSHRQHPQ